MISLNNVLFLKYQELINQQQIVEDEVQKRALMVFQHLLDILEYKNKSLFRRFQFYLRRKLLGAKIKGIYLYGDVGRGKTFVVDLFFEHLHFVKKERTHFHSFMQMIHKNLNFHQNHPDPLKLIAQDIAKNVDVLCLDEFIVLDIGDAMLLAGLFKYLFEAGVILVTTSNIKPSNLYENGLQRQSFLPAIELIESYCQIIHFDNSIDYRLRVLEQAELYHTPLESSHHQKLSNYFYELASDKVLRNAHINVMGRLLPIIKCSDGVVWLSFEYLCQTPRGYTDYLELARTYPTMILEGIIQMGSGHEDSARRFMSLIDILYDHHVKLIATAEVAIEALFIGCRFEEEAQRTVSRLLEMQSHDYLAKAHIP